MRAGIAGAGIMGKLLAFALSAAGWKVSLFDSGHRNNCSHAAAGLLTPVSELEKNNLLIYQMGMDALNEHWPTILSQLKTPVYFQKKGSLVLSHPRDYSELMNFARLVSNKITDKLVNINSISQLEPELTRFSQGYYIPDEGQIDNQSLLSALEVILVENTRVHEIKPHWINNQKFDYVFDCRGLGATSIFPDLRAVRGEIIWLHAPDVAISRPIRFLHPRYSLYLVPRPQQIYLVGASEIESDDKSSISVRTTLELLSTAFYIHPGFAEARIIKTETHSRPTLRDHLPKIKFKKGYIAINGLYRHGFLIAPSIAADVMSWLNNGLSGISYPQLWEQCA